MNSLSWLIYAADTIGDLGITVGIISFVAFLCAVGMYLMGGFKRDLEDIDSDKWLQGHHIQKLAFTRVIPFSIILLLVGSFIPSKTTVLLIAASEMGETVVKTPEAQEIFNDLRLILKKQLEEAKK